MKVTHVSIDRWMDKQNVVYIYTMEYYSVLKRKDSDIYYSREDIILSEISQLTKGKLLHDSTYMRYLG